MPNIHVRCRPQYNVHPLQVFQKRNFKQLHFAGMELALASHNQINSQVTVEICSSNTFFIEKHLAKP
jgi:hypothetical protein